MNNTKRTSWGTVEENTCLVHFFMKSPLRSVPENPNYLFPLSIQHNIYILKFDELLFKEKSTPLGPHTVYGTNLVFQA